MDNWGALRCLPTTCPDYLNTLYAPAQWTAATASTTTSATTRTWGTSSRRRWRCWRGGAGRMHSSTSSTWSRPTSRASSRGSRELEREFFAFLFCEEQHVAKKKSWLLKFNVLVRVVKKSIEVFFGRTCCSNAGFSPAEALKASGNKESKSFWHSE